MPHTCAMRVRCVCHMYMPMHMCATLVPHLSQLRRMTDVLDALLERIPSVVAGCSTAAFITYANDPGSAAVEADAHVGRPRRPFTTIYQH